MSIYRRNFRGLKLLVRVCHRARSQRKDVKLFFLIMIQIQRFFGLSFVYGGQCCLVGLEAPTDRVGNRTQFAFLVFILCGGAH